MKQAIKLLRNRSGQAMVEYVLVLIIGVTLLFVARGFFKNVDTFMSGYIGGYFKCLMVHGELPALGVKDTDLTKHLGSGYKCKIEFTKSAIAAGSSGVEDGTGGTKAGTNQKDETSLAKKRSRSAVSATESSTKGSYGSTKMGRGGKGAFRSASVRRSGQGYGTTDGDAVGGDSVKYIKSPSSSNRTENNSIRKIGSSGDKSDVKKILPPGASEQKISKANKESDDGQVGPKAKKIVLKPAEARGVASQIDEDEGFTLGNLFKWVMMAVLGIILFILFGSQIMSYNNSDSD